MFANNNIINGVCVDRLINWHSTQHAFSFDQCAVAYSGGADSTALLVAAVQAARQLKAHQLTAIHIHHGLQIAADDFAAHAQGVCKNLSAVLPVQFVCERVQVNVGSGDSVEQRARDARYTALAGVAKRLQLNTVLLAHHADDQAESVLLALSRGAGLAGLAGMPQSFEQDDVHFARPLLDMAGPALKAWLKETGVPHIEDPTNSDERYTRNRFRAQVMPAIEAAIPAFRETFARSARHAAQAQGLLESVAQEDLKLVTLSSTGGMDNRISLERMTKNVAPLRWPNVLRHWLKVVHQVTPSTAQLDELCAQIATSQRHGAPRKLQLKVANGFVVRDKDSLHFEREDKSL